MDYSCSGFRDKTKYIAKSEYNEKHLFDGKFKTYTCILKVGYSRHVDKRELLAVFLSVVFFQCDRVWCRCVYRTGMEGGRD